MEENSQDLKENTENLKPGNFSKNIFSSFSSFSMLPLVTVKFSMVLSVLKSLQIKPGISEILGKFRKFSEYRSV